MSHYRRPEYAKYIGQSKLQNVHPNEFMIPVSSIFPRSYYNTAPNFPKIISTGVPNTNSEFHFDSEQFKVFVPPAPCSSTGLRSVEHKSFQLLLHDLSLCLRYIPKSIRSQLLHENMQNSFNSDSFSIELMELLLVKQLTIELNNICSSNNFTISQICGKRKSDLYFVSSIYKIFFSQLPQKISLQFFVNRLVLYSNCSPSAFIVMLIYLDRVQRRCPALLLNELNCHRLVLTSLVLAIKFIDDDVFPNSHYAAVGGVGIDELNNLELTLLSAISWDLNVCRGRFDHFRKSLMESSS